ncbi:MAG: DNA polymerase IV [Clostridia bacterium]|nr:DNA polymerase IV [Oscillospiraceae bacterium]MBQ7960796.1 DNA polymerase IV [Clostridia bacterium]
MKRTVIHLDMDAFFAAIEVRDNPELKGKPLIIGALPTERGVVSTCSYEARKYGIHSAMNIKEAYNRCPHGIYMHGDHRKYAEASNQIHEIMLKYTDCIEFVALDEGYMDVTGSLRLFGDAETIGRQLKKEIFERVGVTCSVGISYCMMAAKLASEEKKPDGFFVIPNPDALVELIRERPVGVISGIGAKTAERLKQMGILTVDDLLKTPIERLDAFGVAGREMLKLASGMDDREVVANAAAKSIGREHTFQYDIEKLDALEDTLLLLARDVSLRAKRQGVWGRTVTLKVKFSNMKSITRSKSGDAVNSAKEIYSCAAELLKKEKLVQKVRLVGVSLSNLQDSPEGDFAQLSLTEQFEPEQSMAKKKNKALEDTIFDLHTRYGRNILKTGKELEVHQKYFETEEKDK